MHTLQGMPIMMKYKGCRMVPRKNVSLGNFALISKSCLMGFGVLNYFCQRVSHLLFFLSVSSKQELFLSLGLEL